MFDLAFRALIHGLYFFALACLIKLLRALWKRPFPTNAPKLVSGYPVVGALQFFFTQNEFCRSSKANSPTGNYSYYLGQHQVIGLCGTQGRKTFFESRDLDLGQGASLLVPFVNLVENPQDPSVDTHLSHLHYIFRTRLLRTQSLQFIPAAIEMCTTATLNRITDKGLIDPFQEMTLFYAQSTMAVMGVSEVALSPELSSKVSKLFGAMDGTFHVSDMAIPWLLNPLHIPTLISLGQLWVMLWQIISKQRKLGQQKQPSTRDPAKENMLQDMIEKGWSTRAIFKANSPTVASWILMWLTTDPQWMARVRQEIEQVIDKHREKGEPAEDVLRSLHVNTWEHEFPLLRACMLEAVRLVVTLVLIRKNISAVDIPIGNTGEVIPPGTYVTYDAREVTRDPNVYPDPQRWDPGRFLPDREEHLKEVLASTGFGGGRHKCRECVSPGHCRSGLTRL
ncbi:cytochrome P450 [Aspergillus eucalypticola CBS 122712]|uniref:Cytochrome P450 n=1 Tax=Aspergillus eucalypticola (strain CBS 122712 / IBT 29274) TaxID=1448314 RepID=A0A317V770_ASPEC|nr:cytochrome P450 [Aspergillus eucalypticola CBS 122712]PWY68807.1 cytochrome P450 [Aspergillus eucalypticola CBS 122712]